MADHNELVSEMTLLEQMGTQERQKLARKRRSQQIKKWSQREKESLAKERQLSKKLASAANEESNGLNLKNYTTYSSNHRNNLASAQALHPNGRVYFDSGVMLLEAAARNDIDEVRRLLKLGVSPDSTNHDGLTALHQCCVDAFEPMMKLLIEFGADVNARDSEQWTPLHAACTCNHTNIVKYLVNSGADLLAVNGDGNMPFDICEDDATLDHIESEMVKRNITQEIIDYTRASTEIKMLKDLQTYHADGGDINSKDKDGVTQLHIAAANGYTSVVKYLLDNGADVDLRDADHWTPLHGAACWGHLHHAKVIELLVQAGADINAKTLNGETPLDICDNPEIRDRLIQLKDEIETKHASTTNELRRTQSRTNSRTHSVRRTSIREKAQISRREAREEALLRQENNPSQNNSDEDSNAIGDINSRARLQSPPSDKNVIVVNGAKNENQVTTGNHSDKTSNSINLTTNKVVKDQNQNTNGNPSLLNGMSIENSVNRKVSATANSSSINGHCDTLDILTNNTQKKTTTVGTTDQSPIETNGYSKINDDKHVDAVNGHSCTFEQNFDISQATQSSRLDLEKFRHADERIQPITNSVQDTQKVMGPSSFINSPMEASMQSNSQQQMQSLSNQISPQASLVFASINCTLSNLKKQRSDLRHRNMNMFLPLPQNDADEKAPNQNDLTQNFNQHSLDVPDSAIVSNGNSTETNYQNQSQNIDRLMASKTSLPDGSPSIMNPVNNSKHNISSDKTNYFEEADASRPNISNLKITLTNSQTNGFGKGDLPPPSPSQALRKFRGDPSEVVGGKERYRTRRCCILL